MKHLVTTFFCIIVLHYFTYSQSVTNGQVSVSDSLKWYFEYDRLSNIFCKDAPPGIYSLALKINKKGIPSEFIFSSDSLFKLKELFVRSMEKALKSVKLKKGKYLQLIYFNNILWCNSSYDSVNQAKSVDKEVINILGNQITSIEASIYNCVPNPSEYFILNPAVINNENPNRATNRADFRNDTKKRKISDEEIRKIEAIINEKKKKEAKSNN